ncbi:MAG TPA: bifunctional homocysteine S-methyltransferase/methylenetetrahydrofolate reductase [Victivallales bacterium]|nr:bifunctional homocysteine S-methyltransferase/methylenetetrahydrofolate reductase [Victivallales bacterium]
MENILKKRLTDEVLIFDGGLGTEIYKRNFFINTCFEELCISSPKIIAEIHEAYSNAGADVLTTNTFGANKNKLSKFGFSSKVNQINSAGVKLARANSNDNTIIAGSVGPIGDIPYNSGITDENIIEILSEQVLALKNAGADFITFETLPSMKDVEYSLEVVRRVKDIPYTVSITVSREGMTSSGDSLRKILTPISKIDIKPTAIGLNCGTGPEGLLSALEKLMKICHYPIIAQPNAGTPRSIDNRTIYMTSPEYFTTYSLRFVNLGVRGVGGCCGTSPEHIKDLSRSIKPITKNAFSQSVKLEISEQILQEPTQLKDKSKLGRKLAKGEWIKTVEIVPPHGYNLDGIIIKAIKCKKAEVDAINIPDGPRASSRMSPIITSLMIQQKADIETILHFCCRDRNLIGMQSDLLGCASAKIRNLLFVTGDPPKLGRYPNASAVFDADSIGMAKIQSNLNKGIDLGGNTIGNKTESIIGVGADPNAIDIKREISRTIQKIEAGAEFIITQPVFDVKPLFEFIEKIATYKIPIIAGIWPLASYRNAEFMKNEVPGVVVPDSIMKRMASRSTKEEQRDEGILLARESVEKIKNIIQGIQVSAPFGNVDTAIKVFN